MTRRHRRGDLVRAVIEGVVFNLHCIHEIMQQQLEPAREFRVIGGAARSRVFRQIMADILGRPVLRPAMMEAATSLGAAMIGAVGTGVVDGFEAACRMVSVSEATEPQKHVAGRYQELFSVFQDAYHALVPVYDRLARLEEEE